MKASHWAVLAMFLAAVSTQLAGMEHGWRDAMTPTFVSGLLAQLATVITAMFVQKPGTATNSNGNGVGPKASAMLLAAALSGGMLFGVTGCAHKSPNADQQAVAKAKVERALRAVRTAGIVVEQVQAAEIALFQSGDVPAATHETIQKGFKQAADTVITATTALQLSSTGDIKDVVIAVRDAIQQLAQTFGHLNAKQAQQLSGWLNTASALLELALS